MCAYMNGCVCVIKRWCEGSLMQNSSKHNSQDWTQRPSLLLANIWSSEHS